MKHSNPLDQLTINTIRLLAADAVEKANSGHPGLPMGAATMTFALWKNFLKGSATDPNWVDRDRFVLSAGHGSMLLYALLHLFGYELSLEDIRRFRQLGSNTPGHPEYGVTSGVEVTTGPLGQGVANAVGMAMAERRLADTFNTEDFNIIDHYTYAICGDGDLMEGVSAEAASLAGHLRLGKLVMLYDDNGITIDGSTSLTFTEDVGARFEAYGWHVLKVSDGNDYDSVVEAIRIGKLNTSQPTLIMVKNIIGYGSPNKAGKSSAHGSPLGSDELKKTKENLGAEPDEAFIIPEEVTNYLKQIIDKREIERFMWEEKLEEYIIRCPEKAEIWKQWFDYELPFDIFDDENLWQLMCIKDATRNAGGKFMNWVSDRIPNLFGGSADLNSSTKTYIKGKGDYNYNTLSGNNVFFGIREHAMGAILNGVALHGGLRAFGSTFLVFSDYMKPPLRLAALMGLPVIHIFTHDSVAVGEDGPTHQPIEHLLMLRSIPNMNVYRPADGRETALCWMEALKRTEGPSCIVLSRQDLPSLETTGKGVQRGAYIVRHEEKERPDMIIMATGSEVSLSIAVAEALMAEQIDVRVVSMPCVEQFVKQEPSYKEAIFPNDVKKRVSIEMGLTLGWERFIGTKGISIGIDRFGESGPGDDVMSHLGFDKTALKQRLIRYYNL
jgi:transketolase